MQITSQASSQQANLVSAVCLLHTRHVMPCHGREEAFCPNGRRKLNASNREGCVAGGVDLALQSSTQAGAGEPSTFPQVSFLARQLIDFGSSHLRAASIDQRLPPRLEARYAFLGSEQLHGAIPRRKAARFASITIARGRKPCSPEKADPDQHLLPPGDLSSRPSHGWAWISSA